MASRGIRNNNPGNIEYGPFARSHGATGSDGRFAIFPTPEQGIRAIAALQTTYENKYGLKSPYERINRWAPAFENNVNSYANAVAGGMGIDSSDPFSFVDANMDDDVAFVAAMIQHENGYQPYDLSTIAQALGGPAKQPSSAAGAKAASGLQGYLPASQVPQPRLRPQPKPIETKAFDSVGKQRSGPLLSEQRGRPPGTPPVPPLPIPRYSPAYSVPQTGAGATGADAVIRGALTGDPAVFAQAANAVLQNGQNAPQAIGAYFQQFAQEQPALARQVAANINGNPAFIQALPFWAQSAVQQAMTGAGAAQVPLPGSQVPVPTVRPGQRPPAVPAMAGYVPNPQARSKPAEIPTFGPISSGGQTGRGAGSIAPWGPPKPVSRPTATPYYASSPTSRPTLPASRPTAAPYYASSSTTRPPTKAAAPASISQSKFNQRFNAGTEPNLSLKPATARPTAAPYYSSAPTSPPPNKTKSTYVAMVPNPAFTEWSNKVASNPSLWNSTPPPKTIAQTVTAPKAVARPAPQVIAQPRQVAPVVPVQPAAVRTATRAPAPSGGARASGGGGGSGGVPSNWNTPSASYSSKSPSGQNYTVSGNTVSWQNSSGQTFTASRDL